MFLKVTYRASNQVLISVNLVPTSNILNGVGNTKGRLKAEQEEWDAAECTPGL